MASYQRIALFILFDSIERDLITAIRRFSGDALMLTPEEVQKAQKVLRSRSDSRLDIHDTLDQLYGLDLGDKYQVLLRHKARMDETSKSYYGSLLEYVTRSIPVRNAVMHGRPLTVNEYSIGFAFAQSLLSARSRWPTLQKVYVEYSRSPETLVSRSVSFLDEAVGETALSNLPSPDYDDTGFLPRPKLEREIKQKILGRHPVINVLGDGGNGKTALALQTLYGLLDEHHHGFDAILWFSAKTSMLGPKGIEQIEGAVSEAMDLIEQAADFQRGPEPALDRLRKLLTENKVLLAIDNLETVTGSELSLVTEDVPGQSKILFTSRVPVGGDLTVHVGEFEEAEALAYLRSLIRAYGVRDLRAHDNETLAKLARRLGNKPLLLKWLVLGVKSGLDPSQITADPKVALKFCLENVMTRLTPQARAVAVVLASIPIPASTTLISHVGNISVTDAESGIGELARFGLLENIKSEGSERLFKLRPFARSYIIRVVSPSATLTEAIRGRFTKLEYLYQGERSQGEYNPYQARNYTIRSISELVAVERLRQATRAASEGDLEAAETAIADAKLSDPGYFEVYRAEAFVAGQSNDVFRAISAYESALEFGDDQPQLHFFFGGLLMRSGYLERASGELEKAAKLDPTSSSIYREAARNEFFRHRFDQAREYLRKSAEFSQKTHRDRVILTDLQIQSYTRELDFLLKAGSYTSIPSVLSGLSNYLSGVDKSLIDQTTTDHILAALPHLTAIEKRNICSSNSELDSIRRWVSTNVLNGASSVAEAKPDPSNRSYTGSLKIIGRKPTFGFVVDEGSGEDFFIHRNTVSSDAWERLREGRKVTFKVFTRKDGRSQVASVEFVD